MCLGCPNQASYTARTCGGGPDALWFGPALRRDAEWEHPQASERRKSKAAAARETIIQPHLKAAADTRDCEIHPRGGWKSSEDHDFRVTLR
jgi:hypothetical protein